MAWKRKWPPYRGRPFGSVNFGQNLRWLLTGIEIIHVVPDQIDRGWAAIGSTVCLHRLGNVNAGKSRWQFQKDIGFGLCIHKAKTGALPPSNRY